MTRLLHVGAVLAGVVLILALGLARTEDRPEVPRPRKKVEREARPPEEAGLPAPPKGAGGSIEALLAAAPAADRPPDVLSGPFKVEGSGEGSDVPAELNLNASQRPIVDALIANRDARLGEIRREVEVRTPKGAEADRLCAEAERAQATCLDAIRSLLLPEQQTVLEQVLKSGRWGGYTLIIPR